MRGSYTNQFARKIVGVNINGINAEWERSRYNDGLRDIIRGSDMAEIYSYLLREFARALLQNTYRKKF